MPVDRGVASSHPRSPFGPSSTLPSSVIFSQPLPSDANGEEPHRKYKRVRPSLKRNEACNTCRRRKLKCDAERPCGACKRQFKFLNKTQPSEERERRGIQCHYGDSEDGDEEAGEDDLVIRQESQPESGSSTRRENEEDSHTLTDRVLSLESTVRDLLKVVNQQTTPNQPLPSFQPAPIAFHSDTGFQIADTDVRPPASTAPMNTVVPGIWDLMNAPVPAQQPALDSNLGQSWEDRNNDLAPIVGPSISASSRMVQAVDQNLLQDLGLSGVEEQVDGDLRALLWPGWPQKLPSPVLLHHLVSTFFSSVPSLPRLLHRDTFLSRLNFPPTHVDFPHPSLLHSICALAARFTAAVKVQTVEEELDARSRGVDDSDPFPVIFPELGHDTDPTTVVDFAERHARYAMSEMRFEKARGRQLFEICQAQVFLHGYYQQRGQWHNNWLMAGQSSRWALFLGLFRNEMDGKGPFAGGKRPVLPPSKEPWDREERRRLMYQIMINDIVTSSGGNWPVALNVDELTVNLPTSTADFELGTSIDENPQNVRAKDLFTSHPVKDSFVIHIKAVALLGQISEIRRQLRVLDEEEATQFPTSRSFQRAVDAYRSLIASFPAEFRDPLTPLNGNVPRLDADLISAHIVPHAAAIMLAEPFAKVEDRKCPHAFLILSASRAIVETVHPLINCNVDLSCCVVPISSLWFYMAARTLGLFYHQALISGEVGDACSYLLDIEALKTILGRLANRSAIARLRLHLIENMMQRIVVELGESGGENGLEAILGLTNSTPIAASSVPWANLHSNDHASPLAPSTRTPKSWTFHPENLVWDTTDTADRLTFREILDQQRCFIGIQYRRAGQGTISLYE